MIFFYLLLLSLNTFGQNNLFEIEYVCTRTLNFKVQTNDILYFDVNKNISYYKEGEFITVEEPDFSKLPSNEKKFQTEAMFTRFLMKKSN